VAFGRDGRADPGAPVPSGFRGGARPSQVAAGVVLRRSHRGGINRGWTGVHAGCGRRGGACGPVDLASRDDRRRTAAARMDPPPPVSDAGLRDGQLLAVGAVGESPARLPGARVPRRDALLQRAAGVLRSLPEARRFLRRRAHRALGLLRVEHCPAVACIAIAYAAMDGRAVDLRAHLARDRPALAPPPYGRIEAERRFIHAIQSGDSEEAVRQQAVESLEEIFEQRSR
jgi:hypothetical protein